MGVIATRNGRAEKLAELNGQWPGGGSWQAMTLYCDGYACRQSTSVVQCPGRDDQGVQWGPFSAERPPNGPPRTKVSPCELCL